MRSSYTTRPRVLYGADQVKVRLHCHCFIGRPPIASTCVRRGRMFPAVSPNNMHQSYQCCPSLLLPNDFWEYAWDSMSADSFLHAVTSRFTLL